MDDARLKILLFGDTHLGFDFPLNPRVERRRRGPDFFDNFHRVLRHAEETRPDLVVHGGDFFFRSRVPGKIVDMAYERLYTFAETGIPLLIVPGNHERSKMPQSLWLNHPNIHVFDRPRTFRFFAGGTSVAVSGFPFVQGDVRSGFRDVLEETGWTNAPASVRFLCMHHAVEGAQVGPSDYTFRDGKDVIKISEVPRDFAAVLAGHIHRRQVLTGTGANDDVPVFYPGSVERTSFAEKDEPKGFFELTFSPDEGGQWRVDAQDFKELPSRPMVDLGIGPEIHPRDLRAHLREQIAALDDNAIVRLKSRGQIDPETLAKLTAPFLRTVFPPSMNVQFSADLYRQPQDDVEHAEK